MQEKIFNYKNDSFIIRKLRTDENVVLFKVFQFTPLNKSLNLKALYGWVDKKLIELTPRFKENSDLLDNFTQLIKTNYQLQ